MVAPHECVQAVARGAAESGELPSELSLLFQEADTSSQDADVDLPLLEIQIMETDHVIVNNSDFVGFATDEHGNHVGRVYHSEYEMELDLRLWTTPDDGYDPDVLGEKLRDALYPYSSYGPGKKLPDEEGEPIEEIGYLRLGTGERVDDLIQTPTVRRWSQTVELWAHEEFRTDEDYITSVDYPNDNDILG